MPCIFRWNVIKLTKGEIMKDPTKMYNKVEAKKNIKKYLIMTVICLPILILLNFTVFSKLSQFLMIFLDVVIALACVVIEAYIWNNFEKKRNQKKEAQKKEQELAEKLNANATNQAKNANKSQKKKGKPRNRVKNNVNTKVNKADTHNSMETSVFIDKSENENASTNQLSVYNSQTDKTQEENISSKQFAIGNASSVSSDVKSLDETENINTDLLSGEEKNLNEEQGK